jgi:hypothetical protein
MLWTDGVFITVDDLVRIDSEVSTVATSENIQFTGINGILRTAVEDAANEMLSS